MNYITSEDYKAAFHGITIPDGPIELGPGAIITNVQLFIAKELEILKNGTSERVKEPVRWRLNRLLEIIDSTL